MLALCLRIILELTCKRWGSKSGKNSLINCELFSYFNSEVLRVGTQKGKEYKREIKPQKSKKCSPPVAYVCVQRRDVDLGKENELCKK